MKVLLLNPVIPDYRLHIFNLLGEKVDLTVFHSGSIRTETDLSFTQKYIPIKHIGPFSYYPIKLHKICKEFDIVISEGNIRYLDRDILILNPFKKYKWINWGIGVSASYKKKFDQDKKFDIIRHFIFKRADAQIFYSNYPIQKYLKAGFNQKTLFVSNNTTYVEFNNDIKYKKYKFLFIGTLYKQKKIFELLKAYQQYLKNSSRKIPLEVIGDGDEFNTIKNWIDRNNLTTKIILHGAIYKQKLIEKHFRESFACFSPGQAGLSVLTSMGYGTPFIAHKEAITGGEIFNIKNGYNGILYNEHAELTNILIDIENNYDNYLKMGKNARNDYLQNRKPEQMVEGIINACKYVLKTNE